MALNLPQDVRQRLFEATSPLRRGAWPFRWVMPEALHLTLQFLGEVPEAMSENVRNELHLVAARHGPIELALRGVGGFPNLRRPRVIWVGTEGGERLIDVQADVVRSLTPLGFEPERRQWSPHLTLGRAMQDARGPAFSGLQAAASAIDFEEVVSIDSVDLMRSHLARSGARYERIHRARLTGGDPGDDGTQEASE